MVHYRLAQICLNGHVITDSADVYPYERRDFCQMCGQKTITSCPSCGAQIIGCSDEGIEVYECPAYCHNCGAPYPWTNTLLEAMTELIDEDSALSDSKLKESLPDILVEGPGSALAASRISKAMNVAGKVAADALRQFVIDFGCELVKSQLGLF